MNQTMWLRCSVVYFIAFLQKPFPIFFFGSHSFRLLIHTDASLRSSAHTDFGRVSKQWFTSSQSTAETERSRKTGMEGAKGRGGPNSPSTSKCVTCEGSNQPADSSNFRGLRESTTEQKEQTTHLQRTKNQEQDQRAENQDQHHFF